MVSAWPSGGVYSPYGVGDDHVCGVDAEDIADMVAEIRALNPKPALAFGSDVAQPVVPDVLMRANPAGGWIVPRRSKPQRAPRKALQQSTACGPPSSREPRRAL